MQAALEITARYCSRELEQYGQCVAAKPESWQRDCHHLKMSIARCTSTHPIIRQIRQACAEPFEAFEECLRQNEATVGNCAEHVRRFLQCAEQVRLPPSSTTVEAKELLKMEVRSDLSLCDLLMVLQCARSSNPQASAASEGAPGELAKKNPWSSVPQIQSVYQGVASVVASLPTTGRLCCHQKVQAEGQTQERSPQPAEETPACPGQVPSVAATASQDDKFLEHG